MGSIELSQTDQLQWDTVCVCVCVCRHGGGNITAGGITQVSLLWEVYNQL